MKGSVRERRQRCWPAGVEGGRKGNASPWRASLKSPQSASSEALQEPGTSVVPCAREPQRWHLGSPPPLRGPAGQVQFQPEMLSSFCGSSPPSACDCQMSPPSHPPRTPRFQGSAQTKRFEGARVLQPPRLPLPPQWVWRRPAMTHNPWVSGNLIWRGGGERNFAVT